MNAHYLAALADARRELASASGSRRQVLQATVAALKDLLRDTRELLDKRAIKEGLTKDDFCPCGWSLAGECRECGDNSSEPEIMATVEEPK